MSAKIVLLGAARRYPAWRAAAAVRAAQGAHGASRAGLDEQEGLQLQEVLAQQSRREQSSQSQEEGAQDGRFVPQIAVKEIVICKTTLDFSGVVGWQGNRILPLNMCTLLKPIEAPVSCTCR